MATNTWSRPAYLVLGCAARYAKRSTECGAGGIFHTVASCNSCPSTRMLGITKFRDTQTCIFTLGLIRERSQEVHQFFLYTTASFWLNSSHKLPLRLSHARCGVEMSFTEATSAHRSILQRAAYPSEWGGSPSESITTADWTRCQCCSAGVSKAGFDVSE